MDPCDKTRSEKETLSVRIPRHVKAKELLGEKESSADGLLEPDTPGASFEYRPRNSPNARVPGDKKLAWMVLAQKEEESTKRELKQITSLVHEQKSLTSDLLQEISLLSADIDGMHVVLKDGRDELVEMENKLFTLEEIRCEISEAQINVCEKEIEGLSCSCVSMEAAYIYQDNMVSELKRLVTYPDDHSLTSHIFNVIDDRVAAGEYATHFNFSSNAIEIPDVKCKVNMLDFSIKQVNEDFQRLENRFSRLRDTVDNQMSILSKICNGSKFCGDLHYTISNLKEMAAQWASPELSSKNDDIRVSVALSENSLGLYLDKSLHVMDRLCEGFKDMKSSAGILSEQYQKAKESILSLALGTTAELKQWREWNSNFGLRIKGTRVFQVEADRFLKNIHRDLKATICRIQRIVYMLNERIASYQQMQTSEEGGTGAVEADRLVLIEIQANGKQVLQTLLENKISDLIVTLREVQIKCEFVTLKAVEQKEVTDKYSANLRQQVDIFDDTVFRHISSAERTTSAFQMVPHKLAEFNMDIDGIQDRIKRFNDAGTIFKEEVTNAQSNIRKSLRDILDDLQLNSTWHIERLDAILPKMKASVEQLRKDSELLLMHGGKIEQRLPIISRSTETLIAGLTSRIDGINKDNSKRRAAGNVQIQSNHKGLQDEFMKISKQSGSYRSKVISYGTGLTNFAINLKDFLDEAGDTLKPKKEEVREHEAAIRKKMNELLQRNRLPSNATRDIDSKMNSKMQMVENEEFKDSLIRIDKIKNMAHKTVRDLEAVQTASDWLFYFLMMLCVMLALFSYSAFTLDNSSDVKKTVPTLSWIRRLMSLIIKPTWSWND